MQGALSSELTGKDAFDPAAESEMNNKEIIADLFPHEFNAEVVQLSARMQLQPFFMSDIDNLREKIPVQASVTDMNEQVQCECDFL